jgi:signal transduction histidine kinase
MDLDSGSLHIWVRTRKAEVGSEITVEDDGPGFDPAIADDPHTTLATIRQRLEMMCSGRLDIVPREEGGTVVKVTIPQQE